MTASPSAGQPNTPVQKIAHENLRLEHNEDRGRFDLWQGDQFIGFLGYHEEDGVVEVQHTIIDEKFGRKGYARALVTMVLEQLRTEGKKIIPQCSYVLDYLGRYPEYKDMVLRT
ncbi:GNAT family N-acetyltransferase [Neomicrococcus aestuarii]|jgi:hypothetical protein|uniref:GNAT family N-acetyltransferase n=1 Tax=Neomicrococcus aestuarii TaxID=556325 RepID=A0A1L2ZQL8_9MICC|nr:GNAT family N-acetyltransferase [Neomicrococcus aestuarii]APF41466.1 GNAT family N-acetyltransferase [Neomicrococcus aestuarii]MBB5513515.1 hypothetical protein [Neomicrococcus aestuarii]